MTGLSEEAFASRAADALECGLLRENGPGQWSFRHPLASHAVYEAIPAQERRAMHLRAGRALEGRPLPPVAELATHFRLAGDGESACRYTERAADLCVQSGDVATSALLLHSLVTTVPLPAEPLARLVTKIQFQALPGSDPYSEIIHALRSALDDQALTPEEEAMVRFQTGRVLMVAGEIEAGRLEILTAVPHLAAHSPEAARALTLRQHRPPVVQEVPRRTGDVRLGVDEPGLCRGQCQPGTVPELPLLLCTFRCHAITVPVGLCHRAGIQIPM